MFVHRRSGQRPADVWMIIASFYPHIAGAEQQAQRLSEQLTALGWRTAVLTRRHNPRYPYLPPVQETINGIPVYRVYSRGSSKVASLLFVLSGLWHLWRNGRGQLYHAHDLGAPALLGILAKLILGGRCLVKIRSGKSKYERRLRSVSGRLQFWVLRRMVDCFVAVSQEGVGMLRDYGIPEHRIAYIPNAVDTDYFHPATVAEKTQARHRLDLPLSKSIVLYIGRLLPVKGVDVLLNAWQQLPSEHRNRSLLLIVGDGPEAHRLQHFVAEHSLGESVCLAGRQENVLDYLHAADLFVLPSRSEGSSNALLEAMACGLPVVASNVGGSADIVEEKRNGALFEVENYNQLAQKLTSILSMPEQWAQMGICARQGVLVHAGLSHTVAQLNEVYNQLHHTGSTDHGALTRPG